MIPARAAADESSNIVMDDKITSFLTVTGTPLRPSTDLQKITITNKIKFVSRQAVNLSLVCFVFNC